MKIFIENKDELNQFAEKLASLIDGQCLICLSGDLAAGKTTFTQFLGKALQVEEVINSPTFTILKQYQGRIKLNHFDMYRLEGIDQDLGFEDVWNENAVTVIEWFEFVDSQLPKNRLHLHFSWISDDQREIECNGIGEKYERIVKLLCTH